MTALTLADVVIQSPKSLVGGVAAVLRETSAIMDSLSFITTGTSKIQNLRQAGLPTIAWRAIGADHGSAKGQIDMVQETAYSFGNYFDLDYVYAKEANAMYDARAAQIKLSSESMAAAFNDAFINGSPLSDNNIMPGLWYRTTADLPSTQKVSAGGVDISADSGAVTTNANTFLDALDSLLYNLPAGKADLLIMNDTTLLRVWSMLRQLGLLNQSADQFGKEFYSYKGARLVDAGYKADQTSRIIGNAESAAGLLTTGTLTSIYAVRTGAEYLTAWQMYPMRVEDLGLQADGVSYRILMDWMLGLAITHPRSVARLYNIQAA